MSAQKILISFLVVLSLFSFQLFAITPTDDTFIDEYSPNQGDINGSATEMKVRRIGLSGYELDALLKFDLSLITDGHFINSATLNMYFYAYSDSNPFGNPLEARRITSSWSESTTSWSNRTDYRCYAYSR